MNPRTATDTIVGGLREADGQLSGDDSPLLDVWEEIKEQLQHEASPYWPVYLEMVRLFTAGLIADLDERAITELLESLKCQSIPAVERKLVQRVLSRGKRERVQYRAFEFECFCYRLLDFTVYGQVLERTGMAECYAKVFSVAAPAGEHGTVDCSNIDDTMTAEQFEHARARQWNRLVTGDVDEQA